MMTITRSLSLAKRGMKNLLKQKPLCISFEITHCCNARCQHCHLGGKIKENRASAEELGRICNTLNPVIAQISGGEPLLRKDVEDIVRAFRRKNRAPYVDITTNGSLLTPERYERLREAGMDQFGISLDYPDERHDDFRRIPGLFKKIEKLITSLNGVKDKMITLICVVQKRNFRDLPRMVELANDWGVNVNFSTYTWMRTSDKSWLLDEDDLKEFKKIMNKIFSLNKKYKNVFTSPYVFEKIVDFFREKGMPNCRTGYRFFNVNPDGTISPCGLIIKDFKSQKELQNHFSANNSCTACYTSIRANTEKPAHVLLTENFRLLRSRYFQNSR